MQVRDLIEELKRHDPHAEVFVEMRVALPIGPIPQTYDCKGQIDCVSQSGNRTRIFAVE